MVKTLVPIALQRPLRAPWAERPRRRDAAALRGSVPPPWYVPLIAGELPKSVDPEVVVKERASGAICSVTLACPVPKQYDGGPSVHPSGAAPAVRALPSGETVPVIVPRWPPGRVYVTSPGSPSARR